jgi:hypothetical protein
VANPDTESITTYNANGEVKTFSGKEKITGETVIKGFAVEARKFFE